jgi:FkbM family methyltransferase
MKYYGQFTNPSVDEYLHTVFFPDKEKGIFIECGANDGIMHSSCLFFEETLSWSGYNIEADYDLFCRLQDNRPNSVNCNLALTDPDSSGRDLNLTKVISNHSNLTTGLSQISMPDQKQTKLSKDFTLEDRSVRGISYCMFCQAYGITGVDLMVLDVEGHELSVIGGMIGSQTLPDVLCVEFPFIGLEKLTTAVKELGYTFHSVSHNNAFYRRLA